MPELPEVETTRRGIAPHLTGQRIARVVVRERRQRWPVPAELESALTGARVTAVERRAKYLLIRTTRGTAIVHLGMTGSLRVLPADTPLRKHEHWDLVLADGLALRMHDPRRFGFLLWSTEPLAHPLLKDIGPEPLDLPRAGLAAHLATSARGKRVAVKQFVMDNHQVVGVGNIYASEALFRARVRPGRAAGRVKPAEWSAIAGAIQRVLSAAIQKGGTTLRDFTQPDGETGYFRIHLNVYDRKGLPCRRCKTPIKSRVQGQRATYWCPACQA
jgi:formamidopyrimidine-DNA glycosylase